MNGNKRIKAQWCTVLYGVKILKIFIVLYTTVVQLLLVSTLSTHLFLFINKDDDSLATFRKSFITFLVYLDRGVAVFGP